MSGLPDDWQSWERLPGEPDNWDDDDSIIDDEENDDE